MSDQFSTTEIRDATGKTSDEWSRIIDAASGREWTHAEVVAYLTAERGVRVGWAELVAARYARERELDADDGLGHAPRAD